MTADIPSYRPMISEEGTVEISFAEKDKRYDNLPAAPSARDNESRKSGRVPGSHNLLFGGNFLTEQVTIRFYFFTAELVVWMREATDCPDQWQCTLSGHIHKGL
jgi:hypothetical protein